MRAAIELSLLAVVIGTGDGPPHADGVNGSLKWANVVQSSRWFPLVCGNLLPRITEMRFGPFHPTIYILEVQYRASPSHLAGNCFPLSCLLWYTCAIFLRRFALRMSQPVITSAR